MKKELNNRKVIGFLARFFGSYFLLFVVYNVFLSKTQEKVLYYKCDPVTENVALLSKKVLEIFGETVVVYQNDNELSLRFYVRDVYACRIIEGCNSLSIIVLFVSFIIAFYSSWKRTLLYILFGVITIYLVNICRIAFIALAYAVYPKYSSVLHDLVFPSIIYGYVFLLWIIWVNRFYKKKNNQ